MKRVLAFLLAVCLTAPAAWAAEDGPAEAGSGNPAPEVLAGQLQSLGLFLGNDIGDFDLDRAPTRAEAMVMLVRALGKEEEAKTLPTGHPFTDVPEWAEGYVSYAYAQGYTKGISDSLLGAEEPCSAEMYLTFLLRALGYEEGEEGDFVYHKPFYQAYRAGIFLTCIDFQDFRRADAVEATAAALFAGDKAAGTPLHEKLEEAGAFTAEEFAAAFPDDPYAWEKNLEVLIDKALDEELGAGQVNRKTVKAQRSLLMGYETEDESVSALVLVSEVDEKLSAEGGYSSRGWGIACYELTLRTDTGVLVSFDFLSDEADLELVRPYRDRFAYIWGEESIKAIDGLVASGAAIYIPPTYAEAVAELEESTGYRNKYTFEAEPCTVFIYDRGGFMNAPQGTTQLIYKPGSAKGEGAAVILPSPRPGGLWKCTPADTMELSGDRRTFIYTYYYDEPYYVGAPGTEDFVICHEAGTYTYTTDLDTGEPVETITPPSYDGALASLTQNPDYTVERQLEGPFCTAVLRWKDANFAEPIKNYELYLVYQPNSPLADTTRQRLILPSTVAVQGYSNVPTDRVPDTLAFSDDGSTLIYTYHFDEALYEYRGDKPYHDAGTYTYTVDLSTGETSVTHTFD